MGESLTWGLRIRALCIPAHAAAALGVPEPLAAAPACSAADECRACSSTPAGVQRPVQISRFEFELADICPASSMSICAKPREGYL